MLARLGGSRWGSKPMAEISFGRTDRNPRVQPQVGSIGGSGSEFAWRMTAASWREPCSSVSAQRASQSASSRCWRPKFVRPEDSCRAPLVPHSCCRAKVTSHTSLTAVVGPAVIGAMTSKHPYSGSWALIGTGEWTAQNPPELTQDDDSGKIVEKNRTPCKCYDSTSLRFYGCHISPWGSFDANAAKGLGIPSSN